MERLRAGCRDGRVHKQGLAAIPDKLSGLILITNAVGVAILSSISAKYSVARFRTVGSRGRKLESRLMFAVKLSGLVLITNTAGVALFSSISSRRRGPDVPAASR